MSFDAITSITQAEAAAKSTLAAAEARTRQMTAEAEASGKAAVEAALKKAGDELAQLRTLADKKASETAKNVSDENENRKAVLRAKAEKNLDRAANLVVERIVNG